MPKVTILPLKRTIEASRGATIMEAAHEYGLYWPTTCGGQGICTTCACTVEGGPKNLEPMGRGELKTLAAELGEKTVTARAMRLACQARVLGNVTIRKRGVRQADAA